MLLEVCWSGILTSGLQGGESYYARDYLASRVFQSLADEMVISFRSELCRNFLDLETCRIQV